MHCLDDNHPKVAQFFRLSSIQHRLGSVPLSTKDREPARPGSNAGRSDLLEKESIMSLETMDTGLSEEDRKAIAEGLSRLLADTYTLYLKTHNQNLANCNAPDWFHIGQRLRPS